MYNVSAAGLSVRVTGFKVIPNFNLTAFADDADPFSIDQVQIADHANNINGAMVVWSKQTNKIVNINLIPESEDDINMTTAAMANLTQGGNFKQLDQIQMIATYPDGARVIAKGGVIIAADLGKSTGQERKKSKQYTFAFETILPYNE